MADSEETIKKVMKQFGISHSEAKDLLQSQNKVQDLTEERRAKVREEEQKCNMKSLYDERQKLIDSLPNFWSTVFSNHPLLRDFFIPEDKEIFKHLSSLEVKNDISGDCSFTFNFKDGNPYFTTRQLVKTYFVSGEKKFPRIAWKEHKVPRGVPYKNKNRKKVLGASFFTWFYKSFSREKKDEIADIIKDDIWINPFKYLDDDDPLKQKSDEEEDDDEDWSDEEEDDDDDDD